MDSIKRFICIAGLPGSGKTFLGKRLMEENNKVAFFDDLFTLEDLNRLIQSVRHYELIIISAPHFCNETIRNSVNKKLQEITNDDIIIEWLFFENNVEKCLVNVNYRNDDRYVYNTIKLYAQNYTIPDGIEPIKIWSPE